jgi:hypothetical protein
VGLGDQRVELRERAEQRIDPAIIGHVVAEIRHGGGVDRRDPHRVDPEPGEVVEARRDARQIADPVAVRVLKRAGIDLIDGPALPPDGVGHAAPLALPDQS